MTTLRMLRRYRDPVLVALAWLALLFVAQLTARTPQLLAGSAITVAVLGVVHHLASLREAAREIERSTASRSPCRCVRRATSPRTSGAAWRHSSRALPWRFVVAGRTSGRCRVARPAVACTVPGCKGRIERGKHPDGAVREWCAVCERRILQLKALQKQLAAPPPPAAASPGAVDDARLATLIAERCVNQAQAHKVTGRSINLIREGIQKAQFPAARIGRYAVIPKASLVAWSKAYRPDQRIHVRTQASLYALPRDAAAAVTVEQWELRAKRSAQSLATRARSHRKDPRLQVVGALSPAGRPVLAYWWNEPGEGANA